MKVICKEKLCTGCSACMNVCSKNAIKMQCNLYGEIHPVIDPSLCINCNLCIKICPVNNPPQRHLPLQCLAVADSNLKNIKSCASGGVSSAMSRTMIQNFQGIVYGVAWNEQLEPRFHRINDVTDICKLKGSKYVQAFVDYTYKKIKDDLCNGQKVLFVGTPCQVSALKNFLRKDYDNLILCEILCHGVPPTQYFLEAISDIKPKLKDKITNCRFRGNDEYNYCFSLWCEDKLLYSQPALKSNYLYAFLTSINLRESCYSCTYADSYRVSDITIGDFLGLGELITFEKNKRNISVVTLNNKKAQRFWKDVLLFNPSLQVEERDYNEAIKGGTGFREVASRNVKRDKFLISYKEKGWSKAIRRVLWKSILKEKIKSLIKKYEKLFFRCFYYIS